MRNQHKIAILYHGPQNPKNSFSYYCFSFDEQNIFIKTLKPIGHHLPQYFGKGNFYNYAWDDFSEWVITKFEERNLSRKILDI